MTSLVPSLPPSSSLQITTRGDSSVTLTTQQPAVRCANMKTVWAGEKGTGDSLSRKHHEVGLGDLAALEAEQSFPLTSSLHVLLAPDQAEQVTMCDWTVTAISPRPSVSLIHTFQVQLKWHVL